MRAVPGLWRWRSNPLCRRTDLVEGWIALAALLLITVGAPLIGMLSATLCHDALLHTVHRQRAERTTVTALVLRPVARPAQDSDPETAPVGSARTPSGSSRHRETPAPVRPPADRRWWSPRRRAP